MKIEDRIHQRKFRNEFHRLLANLIFNGNWIFASHDKLLKPFGITFVQFNVLSILRGQYPKAASVNLIKERVIDEKSDISRLIDRLLAKDLVIRHVCPKDRRQVDIFISQKGLRLLKELDGVIDQFDALVKNLTHAEAKQLNNLLNKIQP